MSPNRPDQLPIENLLDSMAQSIKPMMENSPLLVAIQSGGLWVGEYLHEALQFEEPLGALDISFYRDDFSQIGMNPEVRASYLPIGVDERHVILIDDVLHTGRTVRAALNELFAWGRPSSVILAVLLDRGNRELPLSADIVGHTMSFNNNQFLKISPSGKLTYSDLFNE